MGYVEGSGVGRGWSQGVWGMVVLRDRVRMPRGGLDTVAWEGQGSPESRRPEAQDGVWGLGLIGDVTDSGGVRAGGVSEQAGVHRQCGVTEQVGVSEQVGVHRKWGVTEQVGIRAGGG